MSSSDTYYSDSSTGLEVEILLGQGNYTKWQSDIKLISEGKDVWTLIMPSSIPEGHCEEILTKPARPTKPDLSHVKYQTRGAAPEGEVTAEQEIFRYQLDISEYKLDADAFKEQQGRLRDARTLLLSTVTPAIRDLVSGKVVPSEVMTEIKNLYDVRLTALTFCY